MTERTCPVCGDPLPPPTGRPGRRPIYCSVGCRRDAEYARVLADKPLRTSFDVWLAERDRGLR